MMHRTSSRVLLIVAAFVLFLVPVAAIAAGGFTDVDAGSVFKADIAWLADAGVTKGCNPPTNTKFCPEDNVTREQMSAFMHRLAVNKVVDAKTAVTADSATNADRLDGKDSSAFLTKSAYDKDKDGVVDSAEIKIRYSDNSGEQFQVDMGHGPSGRLQCQTSPVVFDGTTTVVASGGLSLDPHWTAVDYVWGHVYYSRNSGAWTKLNGARVRAIPDDGKYSAAVPINAVGELPTGSYQFAIVPNGKNYKTDEDYSGYCELTVTAYTGQGATTDVVVE